MLESAVAYTDLTDATAAGTALGTHLFETLGNTPPDVVVVFASASYDYTPLLQALDATCRPRLLIGCSSAGEFTNETQGEGAASALALRSSEMQFTTGIGRNLRTDRKAAAEELVSSFRGLDTHDFLYRSALVLTDALAGHADDLVERLTLLTAGTYQFFGGGAGDDGLFRRTHVFYGAEAVTDAVVALEILSNKPIGVGVCHGWQPAGDPKRVTESAGLCVMSVNAAPAVEAFEEHAETTGQSFDQADPLPFFLHNIMGIASDDGHRLRVPLGVNADGSIPVAADVPTGATVQIMGIASASAAAAAAAATRDALRQIEGYHPKVALFFDCVATRLRLGKEFGFELQAVSDELGSVTYAGFNTYGQIARADGQFSGFHNCTAVVCVLPE